MNNIGWTKIVLKEIYELIKPLGYKKKAQNFYLDNNDVVTLINLQKSNYSTKGHLIATINLGAFSHKLENKLGKDDQTEPSVWSCHLRERIGNLSPIKKDQWWKISNDIEAKKTALEMKDLLLRYGIPWLKDHCETEKLKRLWTQSAYRISESQRQKYLKALG